MPSLHKVDCSDVTDDMLAQTIGKVWPNPHNISYSFAGDLTQRETELVSSYGLTINHQVGATFQSLVHAAFNRWQAHSYGLLKFIYRPFLASADAGILVRICGNITEFAQQNMSAVVYTAKNTFKHIHRKIMCFPADTIERLTDFDNNTLFHEAGHAIGMPHFHDYDNIREALMNLPYGRHCSVMPYVEKISSEINQCKADVCIPPYAIAPGVLDERWIRLAYSPTNTAVAAQEPPYQAQYVQQVGEPELQLQGQVFSLVILMVMHHGIDAITNNLLLGVVKPAKLRDVSQGLSTFCVLLAACSRVNADSTTLAVSLFAVILRNLMLTENAQNTRRNRQSLLSYVLEDGFVPILLSSILVSGNLSKLTLAGVVQAFVMGLLACLVVPNVGVNQATRGY